MLHTYTHYIDKYRSAETINIYNDKLLSKVTQHFIYVFTILMYDNKNYNNKKQQNIRQWQKNIKENIVESTHVLS